MEKYKVVKTRDEFGNPRYMIEDTETADWVGDVFDSADAAHEEIRHLTADQHQDLAAADRRARESDFPTDYYANPEGNL